MRKEMLELIRDKKKKLLVEGINLRSNHSIRANEKRHRIDGGLRVLDELEKDVERMGRE